MAIPTTKANPFESSAFKQGLADIQTRANNSTTTTQRMGLGDTSNTLGRNDFSTSQTQSTNANNNAVSTSPYFQRSVAEDNRNFTEDTRRFDATLGAKSSALANEQSTNRYQSDNTLTGNKYNADSQVKLTGIQAGASNYAADRGVDSTRLQADASRYGADRNAQANMYGADKGYQASIYGADANLAGNRYVADSNVRSSQIGADASRFSALLGAGTATLNSQQYRPTFNR